jgi:hypothetical protein
MKRRRLEGKWGGAGHNNAVWKISRSVCDAVQQPTGAQVFRAASWGKFFFFFRQLTHRVSNFRQTHHPSSYRPLNYLRGILADLCRG